MADLVTATQEWRASFRSQASALQGLAGSMEGRLEACKEMRKEQAKARGREDQRAPLWDKPYINWSGEPSDGGGYWSGDPWHPEGSDSGTGSGGSGGSGGGGGAAGNGSGGGGAGNGSGGSYGNGSGGSYGNGAGGYGNGTGGYGNGTQNNPPPQGGG